MFTNKINVSDLEYGIKQCGVDVSSNYVVGFAHVNVVKRILIRSFLGNLFGNMQLAKPYLIVFTQDGIRVSRGDDSTTGKNISFKLYDSDKITDFDVKDDGISAIVSWRYDGKQLQYNIEHKSPGVFTFNTENFKYLLKSNFYR